MTDNELFIFCTLVFLICCLPYLPFLSFNSNTFSLSFSFSHSFCLSHLITLDPPFLSHLDFLAQEVTSGLCLSRQGCFLSLVFLGIRWCWVFFPANHLWFWGFQSLSIHHLSFTWYYLTFVVLLLTLFIFNHGFDATKPFWWTLLNG